MGLSARILKIDQFSLKIKNLMTHKKYSEAQNLRPDKRFLFFG